MATLALICFLVTYLVIMSEKIHRAIVALLGGMFLIIAGILPQERALSYVDWNTLGLLIGMMIVVGITRKTGVFEYLALKSVQIAKGEPIRILIALATITALLSALLDNVTTVLLIVPMTFSIAEKLELNPIPFLMSQILASNIGGTATLIGDPPNIMIGSQTHLGFTDFLINLTPLIIIIHCVVMVIFYFVYRKRFLVSEALKKEICQLEPLTQIKDSALLRKSLVILVLVIMGFILHQAFHLESATVALTGASLLMLVTKEEPEEVLLTIEWPTIFFFCGLFIVVGGLVETGLINRLAQWTLNLTAGNLQLTGIIILWLSAIGSAFVDNIPFVATMIPLIQQMGNLGGISPKELEPLWWALSLGACLGGNGTLIGASANVIVAGLAEKNGYVIKFAGFFKQAFPMMILTIGISTIYLWIRYL